MVSTVSSGAVSAQTLQLLGVTGKNLSKSLAALASGSRLTQASNDIAALSVATGLQTQSNGLRSALQNISQASSFLQTAESGQEQVSLMLDRMRSIATQANSGALSDSAREGLNREFQNLQQEINRVASSTSFNGTNLLDGSLSGDDAAAFQIGGSSEDQVALAIGDVSTAAIFDGASLDVLSTDHAGQALDAISSAQRYITSERANVGSYQEALSYTAANVEVALENQEAARATLADTDFASQSTLNALLQVQNQSGLATLAQSNKLHGNILQLLVQ